MAYPANVIEVFIASPSDVPEERQIVREVVAQWNAVYSRERRVMLNPVGWETHSSPELSGPPQDMISDRLLEHADLLVGIFWTRVGSPTGKATSGTIQEIEEHRSRGRPVMLYFSSRPIPQDNIGGKQLEQLQEFRSWAVSAGLIENYDSVNAFRSKFQFQLPIALFGNAYLREITDNDPVVTNALKARPQEINDDALHVLRELVRDDANSIGVRTWIGGEAISVGGVPLTEGSNRRAIERWRRAVDQLETAGLIRPTNDSRNLFEATHAGFEYADAKFGAPTPP